MRAVIGFVLGLTLLSATDAGARPRVRQRPPIAFWMANTVKGATRADAIHRCERVTHYDGCANVVAPVRGPYVRTHKTEPEDDPAVYVFRVSGTVGMWVDKDGFWPGCDPSGCP